MSLTADLQALGLSRGDHVLVSSDVRFMRLKRGTDGQVPHYAEALLDGLLDVVGDTGTVVVPTFSKSAVTPRQRLAARPFNVETPTTSGGLPQAVLKRPGSLRSLHPTNSFAAIGAGAREFLRFHTPATHCFQPLETMAAMGGKQAVIGCVEISPGFSSVHLAQQHLGLTTRNLLSGRLTARYVDPWGRSRVFHKRDIPGCSGGFGRLYDRYRSEGILQEGRVAGAPSLLIGVKECYEVAREALLEDPTCVLCDDPGCLDCRFAKTYVHGTRSKFATSVVRQRLKRS